MANLSHYSYQVLLGRHIQHAHLHVGYILQSLSFSFFPKLYKTDIYISICIWQNLDKSTDADLQIRRADYKVTCGLSPVQGFVTLITALFKDQLYVSYYKLHHTATIFFSLMETCSTLPFVSVFSLQDKVSEANLCC